MHFMRRYNYWRQLEWAKQQNGPLCFVTTALVAHEWRRGFTGPIRGGLPWGITPTASAPPNDDCA
jgi:hypothetical protein